MEVSPSSLPGEPAFATVTAAGGRQLIAAVNPAAAAQGIAPGLPLADALSYLPGLATRPAAAAEDAAALSRLAEWCSRYSPWTAPDGLSESGGDGIKIETTGSAHLWGGEAALAADISTRLARQGIVHRLAIADTLGAAWAVARHADPEAVPDDVVRCKSAAETANFIVPPGAARTALAPLPAAALRLAPDLVHGLYRVGLRRVGDLMAMPRDALARRFGETVLCRLDQALGDLPEPLSPMGEVPSRRVRLSFAEPIADPADLARAAERLTHDLVVRLAREGMGVRRLGLGFHRVDGRVERIVIGTARPSRDPTHLAKLLVGKLDTVDPGLGIEDAILAAAAVEPLRPEQIEAPLKASPHPNPPPLAGEGDNPHALRTPSPASGGGLGWGLNAWGSQLAPLFDRLGARLGLAAIARLEAHASHIPERASRAVPLAGTDPHPSRDARHPLPQAREGKPASTPNNNPSPACGRGRDPRRSRGRVRVAAAAAKTVSHKPPRPIRLLAPPEPVDAVLWELPDEPPSRFIWRRCTHRVAQAEGPERIAEEWWCDGELAGGDGNPDAIRDYYRVEDKTGRRFWLFRAGLPSGTSRWFIHGLFA